MINPESQAKKQIKTTLKTKLDGNHPSSFIGIPF